MSASLPAEPGPEVPPDAFLMIGAPTTGRISSLMEPSLFSLRAYADAVQSALPRGHGVVAEYASHLLSRLRGHDAAHVGGDNARSGPDRIVDGTFIQTKYCATGSRCVAECFDGRGFRYRLADGTPMQIEVPSDQYDAAVAAMASRIRKGQLAGVADPGMARLIVRRGLLTYAQARRLGKAGSRESLMFDAATGIMAAAGPAGFAAGLSLVGGAVRGGRPQAVVRSAAVLGIATGGRSVVTHILAKQAARTAIDSAIRPASHWVVSRLGKRGVRALVGAAGRPTLLGAAAASYSAKLIRGQVVTAAISSTVATGIDLYFYCTGAMSGHDFAWSTAGHMAGACGGTAGWILGACGGATVGSSLPMIGTTAGAYIGGTAGRMAGDAAARAAVRIIIRRSTREELLRVCVNGDLGQAPLIAQASQRTPLRERVSAAGTRMAGAGVAVQRRLSLVRLKRPRLIR